MQRIYMRPCKDFHSIQVYAINPLSPASSMKSITKTPTQGHGVLSGVCRLPYITRNSERVFCFVLFCFHIYNTIYNQSSSREGRGNKHNPSFRKKKKKLTCKPPPSTQRRPAASSPRIGTPRLPSDPQKRNRHRQNPLGAASATWAHRPRPRLRCACERARCGV